MSSLSLKVSGLDAALLKLGGARKNALPKAAVNALNRTGTKGRTEGDRSIRADLNLTQKTVYNKALGGLEGPNQFTGNKATFRRLESKVTSRYIGMPIAQYVTNKKSLPGSPPRTLVKKGGARVQWLGAFSQQLRAGILSGSYGVFIRRGTGRPKHVFGPSTSQAFNRERDKLIKPLNDFLQKEFDRLVDVEFRKLV